MRYLIYIVSFMLFLTAGVITFLLVSRDDKPPANLCVAKVNGRDILESDLAKTRNVALDSQEVKDELINSLIIKEVLIHEAMQRKIDQEEAFRQSVKNFYEQSLIKTLLDRQQEKQSRKPSEAEISAYLNLYNKQVTINLQPVSDSSQGNNESCKPETIDSLFQNLAFPVRMSLFNLREGEVSDRIDFMGCSYTIKLNKVAKTEHNDPPENREKVAAIIDEFNREHLLRKWIDELVQKASVEINTSKSKEGK